MLIDTHAHPEQQNYDEDREEMLERAKLASVQKIVAVGTNLENSKKVIELSKKYDWIFPTVGVHPEDGKNDSATSRWVDQLRAMAQMEGVRAIGECGLDIYSGDKPTTPEEIEVQKMVFVEQLRIAKDLNLPVVIHCRDGWRYIFDILDQEKVSIGVFHCFTGNLEQAKMAIDRGFYLAVGGILTFKNAVDLQKAVKEVDLKHLVLETDSPFLAPQSVRGERNEPKNVRMVAQFLSELKGVELDEIEEVTTKNAEKLFQI